MPDTSRPPLKLLNGTVIRRGGGVQACAAFAHQLLRADGWSAWHFALSRVVAQELERLGTPPPAGRATVFDESPARSRVAQRRLRALERSLAPEMVFTFFGPAYLRFASPHLCGVADGWVTHADRLAYATLTGWHARLRMRLLCGYKARWLMHAREWMVETAVARRGLAARLGVDEGRIHVVPNSCGPQYLSGARVPPLLPPATGARALCFSHDYPNKDLGMVPLVARRIADRPSALPVEFVLTLPLGGTAERRILSAARALGVEGAIRNVGTVPLESGPALYRSCDLLFHPAVLETFPATYPEAMAMGVPIVTSDLPFAHAICGEAARYFAPRDPDAAADAIASVLVDAALRERLTAAGAGRLKALGRPADKQQRLLALVDGFARRHGIGSRAGRGDLRPPAAC